jgi:predicted GNAT superfamily acetyltransferase
MSVYRLMGLACVVLAACPFLAAIAFVMRSEGMVNAFLLTFGLSMSMVLGCKLWVMSGDER